MTSIGDSVWAQVEGGWRGMDGLAAVRRTTAVLLAAAVPVVLARLWPRDQR